MKYSLLFLLLIPFFSIAQVKSKPKPAASAITPKSKDGFRIVGNVTGFPDGTLVDLMNNQTGAQEAEASIINNKFVLTGKQAIPDFKVLMFNKQQPYAILFLDNSDVKVEGSKDMLANLSITGSRSNDEFNELNRSLLTPYQNYFGDDAPDDSVAIATATQVAESFTKKHPNSFITPLAVIRYSQIADDDQKTIALYNSLSPAVKNANTNLSLYLKQYIEQVSTNGIGSTITDFTQADTAGRPFTLSSLRGHYVLLDFWASWCRPCRMENPNVVAAYTRFKDKNFTVLSVSLDKAKPAWIDAIKMDNLTWNHVSDLQGWGNAVAVQFGITQIPQNILIGPDGKIIAKNLRGTKLDKKLASLLR